MATATLPSVATAVVCTGVPVLGNKRSLEYHGRLISTASCDSEPDETPDEPLDPTTDHDRLLQHCDCSDDEATSPTSRRWESHRVSPLADICVTPNGPHPLPRAEPTELTLNTVVSKTVRKTLLPTSPNPTMVTDDDVLESPVSLVGLDALEDMDMDIPGHSDPSHFTMQQARFDPTYAPVPVTFADKKCEAEWSRIFGDAVFNELFAAR